MLNSTPFLFTVTRREPKLVTPAKPTPRALNLLSDIDDQHFLRFFVPVMLLYPGDVRGDTRDPVKVITEALAEALVYYYPFAGRLREGPLGKLVVDCTGEGVVFVEADADFTLNDLSRESGFLRPPFPPELLCHVPAGSSGILNCPLLLIQVTRFRCGGFLFAMRVNHVMTFSAGRVQFMNAMAELARGASRPSVLPVWRREVLLAREPPRVTCTHREYDQVDGPVFPSQYTQDRLIERSFFFGHAEFSALRRHLPSQICHCSPIELLSAFLWRSRTIAIRYDPDEEVRYLCLVNIQHKLNPPIPSGYYGNTVVFPAAISTARELIDNDLDYAVNLIKKAKAQATEEYVRSVTDLMATHGRPHLTSPGSWLASDNSEAGYFGIDFGWGKPVYGGPSSAMVGVEPGTVGFFVTGKNGKGENGVLILICLPETAMERFAREVDCVAELNVPMPSISKL